MFWAYIVKGGYVMILIGICSVVAMAIFFERFIYLRKTEKDNSNFLNKLFQQMKNNKVSEALYLCEQWSNVLSAVVIKPILLRPNSPRAELKVSAEEAANREILKLESKLPALGTIASIAPLLGLLGTVLGMIESLKGLENASQQSVGEVSVLLNGIWGALITTAAGLIVAIPALSAYNYLVTKVNHLIASAKNNSNEVIDLLDFNESKSK